jgi:hypothetical protein
LLFEKKLSEENEKYKILLEKKNIWKKG